MIGMGSQESDTGLQRITKNETNHGGGRRG